MTVKDTESNIEPTNQVDKLTFRAYLIGLYDEVSENLDYLIEVEGVDISSSAKRMILTPLAFAIANAQHLEQRNDLQPSDSPSAVQGDSKAPPSRPTNKRTGDT